MVLFQTNEQLLRTRGPSFLPNCRNDLDWVVGKLTQGSISAPESVQLVLKNEAQLNIYVSTLLYYESEGMVDAIFMCVGLDEYNPAAS